MAFKSTLIEGGFNAKEHRLSYYFKKFLNIIFSSFLQTFHYIVIIKVITMQTKLIQIGNSFGIRIPKSIIRQFDLDKNNLEIVVKEDGILITPVSDVPALKDWESFF